MAEKELLEWKSFSKEQYEEEFKNVFHYSAKYENTNAIPNGVRLSDDWKIRDVKYVSGRVVFGLTGDMPLDYGVCAGDTPKVAKQIELSKNLHGLKLYLNPPQNLVQELQKLVRPFKEEHFDSSIDQGLCSRVKQVLIPDEQLNYISISPIRSAALVSEVNNQLQRFKYDFFEEKKASKKRGYVEPVRNYYERIPRSVDFQLGGGVARNAGGNVYQMRKLIMADFPTSDVHRMKAKKLSAQGLLLKIPNDLVQKYIDFYQSLPRVEGAYLSTMQTRQDGRLLVEQIAKAVWGQIRQVRAFVFETYEQDDEFEDYLKGFGGMNLDRLLIENGINTKESRDALAKRITSMIASETRTIDGLQVQVLSSSSEAQATIIRWVDDYLFKLYQRGIR